MRTQNECAGYKIVASVRLSCSDLPNHQVCLGMRGQNDYATWEYNDNSQFYWGHYNMKENSAYADMYERAAKYYRRDV